MKNPFHWRRTTSITLTSPTSTAELGALGERLVIQYLKANGYRLVATNFTAPLGYSANGRLITGEIDLIAYDETSAHPMLCFIEVKTRSRSDYALPQAAVDLRKQRQIIKTARIYRRVLMLKGEDYRYDVASVVIAPGHSPEITLLKSYFSEASFSRSHWHARGDFV